MVRIDADHLAATDLLIDPGRGAICHNGRWIAPTVTWNRHFSERAIDSSESPAYDMFLRDSWRAAAGQLTLLSPVAIGLRKPGLLEQLQLAQRCQIAIPRTVVTADPTTARHLGGDTRRLIIKALDQHFVEASPGRLSGAFPVVVDSRELQPLSRPGPPVIVQEYVQHDAELRVYYVDGQVHGFEVSKEAASDPWLAADRVAVRHAELPTAVVAATELIAEGLSLRYGAFDFLLRGGTPVFLEVNADGDWRWAERKAQAAPVTLAVARMLCELHRNYCPPRAKPCRGADIFDLISFLSP